MKCKKILNEQNISMFTKVEMNVFFSLIYVVTENPEVNEIELKAIKKLSRDSKNGYNDLKKQISSINSKLQKMTFVGEDGKKTPFLLFETLHVSDKVLEVKISKQFEYLFIDLFNEKKSIAIFDLEELTMIESKYSKTLYRKLSCFKRSKWFKKEFDELVTELGFNSKYKKKDIKVKLKDAIKKLDVYFRDISISYEKKTISGENCVIKWK
ncbi:replication initiation protein [Peptostreptococcus faecalis]|uniref:replication initiation protein n=1 Tax=Peptostreptococcus faecalis TaxID=2045015 RepID=UPI0011AEF9E0|nr:replication initiation protein [Peptostreptococcus faecalis]